MEDGVVGRRAAQLDHFGRDVNAARRRHDLDWHAQAELLGQGFAAVDRIAAEFGIGIDKRHFGTRLFLGNVAQQDAEHFGVVGADQELVRVFHRVVQLGRKRGTGHQDVAGAFQFGVDGLGKRSRVTVVEVDLVLARDLLERRHRNINLVAGVFRHIA